MNTQNRFDDHGDMKNIHIKADAHVHEADEFYFFELMLGCTSSGYLFSVKIEDNVPYYLDAFGTWQIDGTFPHDKYNHWLNKKVEDALLDEQD